MHQPTPEELQVLARLSLDEFKLVMKFLNDEREQLRDRLETMQDDAQLRALQGKAQCITELFALVAAARAKQ